MIVEASPYSALARHYDALLGRPMLRLLCSNFERLAPRFGIRFGDAADLGCGTGLFARYLATRFGVPVYGVDRSPAMIAVAAKHCQKLPVTLIQQDIRGLLLPRRVDLITSNYDTLNHLLSPRDLLRALRRVAAHLRPKGHFVADLITTAVPLRPGVPAQRTLERSDARVTQQVAWLPEPGLLSIRIIEQRGPGLPAAVERHTERAYPLPLIRALLAAAGLRARAFLNALTLEPFTATPSRVVMVCARALPGGLQCT